MRKVKILREFRKSNDNDLELEARSVITGFTGNAYFPTPNPTLAVMNDLANAYEEALSKSIKGSILSKKEKDARKLELINNLDVLASYAEMEAKNDIVILASTNFKLSQPPAPLPPLVKPDRMKVRAGEMPGQLWLEFGKQKATKMCIYQWAVGELTESTQWTTAAMGTRSRYLFTGLPSRQLIYLRVVLIGNDGQEVASDAVSMVTQ